MNKCYIVGACKDSFKYFTYDDSDLIIGVDGGYDFLMKNNYRIDYIIGDFDSLGYVPSFDNVIKLNPIKDVTDMMAALDFGVTKGYSDFIIYGCIGGRFDHTVATLQNAYAYAKKGYKINIVGVNEKIIFINNEAIELNKEKGYISIFALEKANGVTIKNLKYELNDSSLSNDFPLGVSNEFINKKATIQVKDGCLMIIY